MVPGEILGLILATGASVFCLRAWSELQRLPRWRLLLAGFGCLVLTLWATNLETFFLHGPFNVLEHAAQAASAVLLATWCWHAFMRREATA